MNGKSFRSYLFLILLGGWISIPLVSAQQSASDAAFVAPRSTSPSVKTTTLPERRAPMDIGGIVAQAFNMKQPLQMINPLAPAKYGDGRESVSWDPDKPEKPKGIILFGIQW